MAALLASENASVAGFRLFCIRPRVRATVSSEPWRAAAKPFAAIPEVVGFDWIASNMDVIPAPKKTPRRPDWRRHAAAQHSPELVLKTPHYNRELCSAAILARICSQLGTTTDCPCSMARMT